MQIYFQSYFTVFMSLCAWVSIIYKITDTENLTTMWGCSAEKILMWKKIESSWDAYKVVLNFCRSGCLIVYQVPIIWVSFKIF